MGGGGGGGVEHGSRQVQWNERRGHHHHFILNKNRNRSVLNELSRRNQLSALLVNPLGPRANGAPKRVE